MLCPHCNCNDVIFQATNKVEVLPTVSNWKLLPFTSEVPAHQIFICCECSKRVKIDLVHKYVTKMESDPIFDEVVAKIITLAKMPDKQNEFIPSAVIDALKTRRFIGIHRLLTGKELVSKIIEQKP